MSYVTTPTDATTRPAAHADIRLTRTLLTCGVLAGPLYLAVAAGQVVTREGFDLRQHAVSQLSNGDWGWVQIANFAVTGALTIAGAAGIGRALRHAAAGRAAAALLGLYGVSLIAAGAFVADPAFGFPDGAPAGAPDAVSWHGAAHLAAGGIGFLAFVVACGVLARWFAATGRRGWARWSAATGVLFLVAFAGIASGRASAALNLAFTAAVVGAWTWLSAVTGWLRSRRSPR